MLAGLKFFQALQPVKSGAAATVAQTQFRTSIVSAAPAELNTDRSTGVSMLESRSSDSANTTGGGGGGSGGGGDGNAQASTLVQLASNAIDISDDAGQHQKPQPNKEEEKDGPQLPELKLPADAFVKFSWGNGTAYTGRLFEPDLSPGLDSSCFPPSYVRVRPACCWCCCVHADLSPPVVQVECGSRLPRVHRRWREPDTECCLPACLPTCACLRAAC